MPRFTPFHRALAVWFLWATAVGCAATLPPGFSETQIASNLNPTSMSIAPDGRIYLCEKQGLLRVISGGAMLPTPVLDISGKVDSWNERGLLSVCFDPQFSNNGWIYIYYTHDRDPGDAGHTSSNNRLCRFTTRDNVADPNSEVVLLELNNLSKVGYHNGGGLSFGNDGKLYLGVGENGNGPNAQDSGNLLGKLLRLNADGSIPTDNPHYAEYAGANRAIAALGLRNPFHIAVQRTTGLLYLSMVGAVYEQIEAYDTSAPPTIVNYGWPGIDGPPRKQLQPAGYRAPAYAYDHGSGDATALCGGDFYNPAAPGADAFPAEYTGKFIFSDYKGWLKMIDPAKPGIRLDFATKIDRPIDVAIAPDGALWYIARAGIPGGSDAANTASTNGSLWRVRYIGGGQAVKLTVIQQPGNTYVDAPIGDVKVALQDANGATITTASGVVTLALEDNPAAGSISGATKVAAVAGVATFPSLAIGQPGRGYHLRASCGTLSPTVSAAFDIGNQIAAPRITPPGGSFSGPVWIEISSSTPGAVIRYTSDGNPPDDASAIYTGPFQITESRQIQAIAQKSGLVDSASANAKMDITGSTPYGLAFRSPISGLKLPATAEGLPATLSAIGVFSDQNLTVKAGVIPYTLNSPAWADGAQVQRWVALPDQEKIGFAPTGEYLWPGGAIFIQHFEIVTDQAAATRRRLETRLLALDDSGAFGYGATYRWRPDGSDADLVEANGQEETLKIADASGDIREQKWTYPARGLCFMCHTPNAGFVLGPKTRQLNGPLTYPGGLSDNQLRTWNYLQMFSPSLDEKAIPTYARTVPVNDATASLEDRARSYLDANCAECHRPNGAGAVWDARFDTPLARQGLLNGEVRNNFGIENTKVVVPGDPERSMLHVRLGSSALPQQMPPVTRNVVDAAALDVVGRWIRSLAEPPPQTGPSR